MASNPTDGGNDRDKEEDVCDDQVPEADPAAAESPNRSSSFLFDSMYDSPLLVALRPNQMPDQPDQEQSSSHEVAVDGPLPSTQQKRCSELLANQEAEEQEAVQWGESFFNLSEWGDSLLVGEHFLGRQSLLRHAKRTESEQELQQPNEGRDICDEPLLISQLGRKRPLLTASIQTECDEEKADNHQAHTRQILNSKDFEPNGRQVIIHEKGDTVSALSVEKGKNGEEGNSAAFTHLRVQNESESALYCSPGLQEIFDRWPSMSDQSGSETLQTQATASNTPGVPGFPPPDVQQGRKRKMSQSDAAKNDFHKGHTSRHERENTPERPDSAGDLVPPTQERPPVTPRVKLTTSSVQSPVTAQPLQQSTPSNRSQDKLAARKHPAPQTGNYHHLSDAACASVSKQEANRATTKEMKSTAHSSCKTNQSLYFPSESASPPLPPHYPQPKPPPDAESPLSLEGFTLQLSQDASLCCSNSGTFSIIDVASDRHLFDTFVKEWETKERFSIALACEKSKHRQRGN